MSLGFDTYEDNRSFEQKGLTGEVKRYSTGKLEYPNIIIVATEEKPVEMYKFKVLHEMFGALKSYNEDEANLKIHMYFKQGSQLAKVGIIQPKQVKSVMKLFDSNLVEGFFDADTELIGDYIYVLSE